MTSHLVFRSWFLNLLNTCQAGKELDEFGVSISLCHKLKSCSKLMKILSERYRRQYKGRGKGITTKVQGYLFRGHKTCLLFVLVITWLYIHTEFKRIYWKGKFYCKISQFKKKRIATIYNPQNIRIHAYKVNKYEWVREVQKTGPSPGGWSRCREVRDRVRVNSVAWVPRPHRWVTRWATKVAMGH